MASTSKSTVQKSFKNDVFLSFAGEDTRKTFVGHLLEAFVQRGIQTYKDTEMEKGERPINTQLMEAIVHSRFHIILFSKNYAGSTWCLDELVKIMECRKPSEQSEQNAYRVACEQTSYPVFYDVEPTEIRKQSGAVEIAFEEHKGKEGAGKWREALKEASNLPGWELKATANGVESELIKIIVDDISEKISYRQSSVYENLVGMETRIEAVLSSLKLDTDDVRMIGIWGMGGGGKTTLARAVFDRIFLKFEGRAFVEKVRDESKSPSGLKELQRQVLSSVGKIPVGSVHEGTHKMKENMHRKKVLIVLDDVDDTKQLEALVGVKFKSGSRVIITTRDKQVLSAYNVKFIKVDLLSHAEAISLFNKYAFFRDNPIVGYEELTEEVVQYANGLPSTIRDVGSLLCGKTVSQWGENLKRLKKIPFDATMKLLELSYNDLETEHKEIFLDVACLLNGSYTHTVIRALESCGFFSDTGLTALEEKSLITYNAYGQLCMHGHTQEMGKNIVRRVNPNEPKKHSRLWIQEEIEEIMADNSGTEATKGITMIAKNSNFKFLMKGLTNMKELRFLYMNGESVSGEQVRNWNFDEDDLHLPNALQFLTWYYYPFPSLPKTFQAKNLVGLEMFGSSIVQLWKDGEAKACLKLTFLKFTSSWLRTLDLSVAPNLETLILESCHYLVEVHFQVTPNLKELRIHDCKRLEKLHMPAESPELTSVYLYKLKLRTLHLGITRNLVTVRIRDCADMVEFRMPAECSKLTHLDLGYCKQVAELPQEIGRLECLKELYIQGTSIHLPQGVRGRKGLHVLPSLKSHKILSKLRNSKGPIKTDSPN